MILWFGIHIVGLMFLYSAGMYYPEVWSKYRPRPMKQQISEELFLFLRSHPEFYSESVGKIDDTASK